MASPFTNVNITHMNVKQLKKVAKDVVVSPIVIDQYLSNNSGKSGLITAIKAK